jgi:broad specificity phosphatase PhoE
MSVGSRLAPMLTLVLTRHGLTDQSVPDQHIGQHIDISINADGRRQAEALGRRLSHVAFDRIITSPLFRARETAELVARGLPAQADPRLREMDYGAWEGRTHETILATDRALRHEWEAAPDTTRCPGGERGEDVAVRVRAFLVDLLEEQRGWHARAAFRAATSGGVVEAAPERRVLVVGHATTNRILLSVALDTDLRGYRRRFEQGQANLTVLRWESSGAPEDATLLLLNDLAHLRGPRDTPWG